MPTIARLLLALILAVPAAGAALGAGDAATPLQPLIDAAPPGGTLQLDAKTYSGPALIDKPLTLDGGGQATLENDGSGTVLTIKASHVTVKELNLRGSGQHHNDIDACIHVRGHFNKIVGNRLSDCLFGIDLQESNHNVVAENHISSYDLDLGLRGDAIRLYYSMQNQVTDNVIRNSRDMVAWYSSENLFARNDSKNGRYSLHFMYANHNRIVGNSFDGNAVGVFLMYSEYVEMEDNLIRNAMGATGLCLGLKDSSEVHAKNNRFVYCASGIYLDQSPFQPELSNSFTDNEIAFNRVGVLFHMTLPRNHFTGNRFQGNFTPVAVDSRGTAATSVWEGNFWDQYQGFDNNGDGVGDVPYELRLYADKLWIDAPNVKFFFGSPVMSALDFLEKLAPFSDPELILRDPKPRFTPKPPTKFPAHG